MAKESRARHLRIRLSSPLRRRKVWHQTAGYGNEAGRPGFAKFEARVAVFRIVEAGGIEQGAAAAATAAPADSLPILAPAAGGFLLAGFVKGGIGLGRWWVATCSARIWRCAVCYELYSAFICVQIMGRRRPEHDMPHLTARDGTRLY